MTVPLTLVAIAVAVLPGAGPAQWALIAVAWLFALLFDFSTS